MSSKATLFIERVESVKGYSIAADQGSAFAVRKLWLHLNLANYIISGNKIRAN